MGSFPLTEVNSFLKGGFISDFIFSLSKARSVFLFCFCRSLSLEQGELLEGFGQGSDMVTHTWKEKPESALWRTDERQVRENQEGW